MRAWYADMPRSTRMLPQKRPAAALAGPLALMAGGPHGHGLAGGGGHGLGGGTIDRFYLSRHCVVCDELTGAGQLLCPDCRCGAAKQRLYGPEKVV